MKNKLLWICLHIFCWLVFFSLPFFFFSPPETVSEEHRNIFYIQMLISNFLLVFIYYFNQFIGLKKFYFSKKYVWFGLIQTSVLFIMIVSLSILMETMNPKNKHVEYEFAAHHTPPPTFSPMSPLPDQETEQIKSRPLPVFGSSILRFFIVVFVSIVVGVSERWQNEQKQRLEAELSYLKAQINPHFLFNTLNSIYSLAIRKSDKAPDAIIQLSSIMRYVISESNQAFVSLEKEIEYLTNYIDLQKMRLNAATKVDFVVEGIENKHQIAPLIFIHYIENAFKYGVSTEIDSTIFFHIYISKNAVTLWVKNTKFMRDKWTQSTKTGLKNSQQHLETLYAGRYDLKIKEDDNFFEVKLKIDLA